MACQVLVWTDAEDAADWDLAQSVVRWTAMLPLALQSHVRVPGDVLLDAEVAPPHLRPPMPPEQLLTWPV